MARDTCFAFRSREQRSLYYLLEARTRQLRASLSTSTAMLVRFSFELLRASE